LCKCRGTSYVPLVKCDKERGRTRSTLQASLYNQNKIEPLLRYGVIEKIFNRRTWKGIRFDDYFRMILAELHSQPKSDAVKVSHCEAIVHFAEKAILDVREDADVVDLCGQIAERYGHLLLD
jgi:hypothetical protein